MPETVCGPNSPTASNQKMLRIRHLKKCANFLFEILRSFIVCVFLVCCVVWNSIYKPLHYHQTFFQFLLSREVQEWTSIGYKFAASYKHLKFLVIRYIFYVSKTIEDVLLEPLWLPFQKREFISWQFDMPCVFLKDNLKSTKGTKSNIDLGKWISEKNSSV